MTPLEYVFKALIGMYVKYRNATTPLQFWQVSVYSHKKEDRSIERHSIIMSSPFEKENHCQLWNHSVSTQILKTTLPSSQLE